MKTIWAAFRQFIQAIWKDAMLAACVVAPILMAVVLYAGVPVLERALCAATGNAQVLTPYYALFDLTLSLMTPIMLCFSGVMVVLEELDDGTAKYLMVTPLGKFGYLVSRIGIFTGFGMAYAVVLLSIFSLSGMSLGYNVLAAVVHAVVSVSVAMLVIGIAKNKVEGMALVKLSGFFFLGYLAAYLVAQPLAVVAGVLPGYWLSLMMMDHQPLWALPAIGVAGLWIVVLYRRFYRRVLA